MAGIKVRKPLAVKESITGTVQEVTETCVILEIEGNSKTKLPLPEEVLDEINDKHNSFFGGDKIKITRGENDEYEIEEAE
jgi:hypothetical protein